MNISRFLVTAPLFLISIFAFAQEEEYGNILNFELASMPENAGWGVFLSLEKETCLSEKIFTGSGQVTLVAPVHFVFTELTNCAGTWMQNARVDSPAEAPDKAYISFGFVADEPKIELHQGQKTLLFTIAVEGDFSSEIALIDNENDPFLPPNSLGSNPGNEIGMIGLDWDEVRIFRLAANADMTRSPENDANRQPLFTGEKTSGFAGNKPNNSGNCRF